MRKSACVQLFEKYLSEVSNGRGYREHENPAVRFSRDVKKGKYNKLSDECYETLLQEIKEISAFWLNKPDQQASDILQFALENIDIDKKSLQKMAEILAKCYSASMNSFTSEDLIHKLETSQEDFDFGECLSEVLSPKERSIPFLEENDLERKEKDFEPEQESHDGEGVSEPLFEEDCVEECETANPYLGSPRKINDRLSKYIYGQEKAVMAASMLLYNHIHGRKRNILFIGPTGSGKTEIWRVCKQLYPCIRIIDSTIITGEGWKGDFKVSNIFDGMSPREAEQAIIVFDEFDKLCEPKITSGGSNYSMLIQNELLKLIEGTTIILNRNENKNKYKIDTSNISFVFCGSFECLTEMKTSRETVQSIGFGSTPGKKEAYLVYEEALQPADLVKYAGMRQEIAGRINQIVQLTPMTAGAYREILKDWRMSPLHQLERQYGVKLSLDQNTEQKLLQEAEETHMGVRYLRSRIQQMLDEQMFLDCSRKEYLLGA